MTLPTSGPLSLADIQTEFGGSNPVGLSEYYAGGTYVPAGTTGTYGAVPSSGAITIQNFYGTTSVLVNFNNVSVSAEDLYSAAAASYRVKSTGYDYKIINGAETTNQQWITPTSQGGNYEVYATVTSGTITTGTFGSWLATTTNPTWGVVARSGAYVAGVITMQVRKTGTTTVIDTWTVSLEASQGV